MKITRGNSGSNALNNMNDDYTHYVGISNEGRLRVFQWDGPTPTTNETGFAFIAGVFKTAQEAQDYVEMWSGTQLKEGM
jgi:hypothetical protein